ncbi:hypothetical protein KIPB_009010 [Kipferlia bialata]|uniref:Uncharacterized protein n=1 Tax=Kipferlia bialata TaxID=797122 RepID=A0A9K3D109_9EUKA|nr:hypothetical protein KIPB_009010 [Kipferlia bialata]|eukprot:g9010.t1
MASTAFPPFPLQQISPQNLQLPPLDAGPPPGRDSPLSSLSSLDAYQASLHPIGKPQLSSRDALGTYFMWHVRPLHRGMCRALILSLFITLVWTYLARDLYHYANDYPTWFGVFDSFPVILWFAGLTLNNMLLGYLILPRVVPDKVSGTKGHVVRTLVHFLMYSTLLISGETFAYHVLGISNNMDYPGLPICDCLHAPAFMKVVYFLLGPLSQALWYYIPNVEGQTAARRLARYKRERERENLPAVDALETGTLSLSVPDVIEEVPVRDSERDSDMDSEREIDTLPPCLSPCLSREEGSAM